MRIVRTDEQEALTGIVRDLVATTSPPERVAELADGGAPRDDAMWARLRDELGVTGLLVPERFGGAGATWREVAAVAGELGRALVCVPFVTSSVIATTAVLATGDDEVAADLLPGVADGSLVLTVAAADIEGTLTADGIRVRAREDDGGWRLDGEVAYVADGTVADRLLVLTVAPAGPSWFVVDPADASVAVHPMTVLDPTRPLATVTLEGAIGRPLGEVGAGWAVAEVVIDAATVALAAEQVAAAEHLLDLTVAYAKDRIQFGQPIGSFQAIQHALADLTLRVDEARSALELAVWAASDAPDELREGAAIAGVVCAETLRTVATEAIQIHGGIGFTWEHVAHRYFRRAHGSSVAFGTPALHRERLLAAIGV
ncbi:acyl-CoA dehydrogenase [Nitriliruptoraceae bacterium ZYF776]|nr:acyl-CoA dehydrogenase [Profundirhabdus halotolerans]